MGRDGGRYFVAVVRPRTFMESTGTHQILCGLAPRKVSRRQYEEADWPINPNHGSSAKYVLFIRYPVGVGTGDVLYLAQQFKIMASTHTEPGFGSRHNRNKRTLCV